MMRWALVGLVAVVAGCTQDPSVYPAMPYGTGSGPVRGDADIRLVPGSAGRVESLPSGYVQADSVQTGFAQPGFVGPVVVPEGGPFPSGPDERAQLDRDRATREHVDRERFERERLRALRLDRGGPAQGSIQGQP